MSTFVNTYMVQKEARLRFLKTIFAGLLTVLVAYEIWSHFEQVRSNVVARDSIAYWTAARLLLCHQDPYDHAAVLSLEREQGYMQDKPLVLRTPPWSLPIFLPLGLLGPVAAWIWWTMISLGSMILSMRFCRGMYGSERIPQNLFTVVGYCFAPVPACLVAGQMGLILLLGLILFFRYEQEQPLLAGAALVLPFAKPHLLSLFWVGVFFWIIYRRKTRVAIGFLVVLCIASLLTLIFDPHVFVHYRRMLHNAAIGYEFIPALSGVLRLLFFRSRFWVQFVPMLLAIAWSFRYVSRNRANWDWQTHGPLLLIISVLTTPYAWLTDEVVLLPAMLQAAAFVYYKRAAFTTRTRFILLSFALLDILLLLILRFKIPFATGIYFWSSLVWLAWYAYALRMNRKVRLQALDKLTSAIPQSI